MATPAMVKIKLSISKKRYLKGKRVYEYKRGHFLIPSKILKKLESYLREDFKVETSDKDDRISLTYTYWKKPQPSHTNSPA